MWLLFSFIYSVRHRSKEKQLLLPVLRHIAKRFIAIPSKDNKGCCEISTKQQPKSFIIIFFLLYATSLSRRGSNFGPVFPRKLFLYCHEIHIDHHCRVGFLLLSVQIPEFWASSESLRSAKRTIKLSRRHHHRLRGCHPINNMQSGRAIHSHSSPSGIPFFFSSSSSSPLCCYFGPSISLTLKLSRNRDEKVRAIGRQWFRVVYILSLWWCLLFFVLQRKTISTLHDSGIEMWLLYRKRPLRIVFIRDATPENIWQYLICSLLVSFQIYTLFTQCA
jgi:hypothetical protein